MIGLSQILRSGSCMALGGILPCLCLLTLVKAGQAVAGGRPSGPSVGMTQICQTEQAIGFRWVRGKWKSTDFVPDRYIVVKMASGATGKGRGGCKNMAGQPEWISLDGKGHFPGCYSVRRQGQELQEVQEQICSETQIKEGGRWRVLGISCEKFKFKPDGWFHRTSLHDDLEESPELDDKDPLSVAVGHCRSTR